MTTHFTRYAAILFLLLIAACTQQETPSMIVTLIVDGRERSLTQMTPITVGEFLREQGVETGTLDRVNPPIFTQISDGMRITLVRVEESTECEEREIPNRRRTVLNEGLQPGEERLGQAGQNGVEQVCFRVTIEDGVGQEPVQISRTTITAPQDEVVYVGPTGELDPVQISGTLAYISNRNVWLMRGSSTTKRPLTTTNDIDGLVFRVTADGRQILFTREADAADRDTFFNRLWLISNSTLQDVEPVALVPENVLYADFVPNTENTISYSTAEARDAAPGWNAYNDLWVMRIDPQSGDALTVEEMIPRSSGGLYGWWGTSYQWSPDGSQLAWVRADSSGLVDLENGSLSTLLTYPVFNTRQPWSWRATVAWSPDTSLLLTTIHGDPIGSEPAESSPAFHVAATAVDGTFNTPIAENTGIWSQPIYSPIPVDQNRQLGSLIAYLKARDISNSIGETAEYDLILADRDGSNARVLFPEPNLPGLTAQAGITWSPDGTQIAMIYEGNLWTVDVTSGIAHKLTLDGSASKPVWVR